MMIYTNCTDIKYLDCSRSNDSESQTQNKVAEKTLCTTIYLKQEEDLQPTDSSYNRHATKPFVSRLATTIAALSMLEGATGLKGATEYKYTCRISTDDYIPRELCSIASSMCKIINIRETIRFDTIIKEAFSSSINLMKARDVIPMFNLSVPLLLPSDNNDAYDCDGKVLPMMYFYMDGYIKKLADAIKNELEGDSYNSLCVSDNTEFCSSKKNLVYDSSGFIKPRNFINPKGWIFNRCCPSIKSYVNYPALSLTEKEPVSDVGSSSSTTTLVIALFAFSSLAVSIFTFIRCKYYNKSNKVIINQPQAVPMHDITKDGEEDIV
ncbi:hypothetical protein [Candidatus Ichthyocystis sparus]|uniref:hypothetical protein n=1 Tax=Candidatus Ichthyocystis sparus TaxID=1561004 RepID=UPI00159EC713|nr:hypothetical protein [Candidatus Ichthyocystis sparus]